MATVKYKVVAYVDGSKEVFRSMEITNAKDYEIECTIEEFSTFIDETWDEAQEEEEL